LTGWWLECLRRLKTQHPEYEIEGFCFHTSLQAEFQEMTRLFSLARLPDGQVLAPTVDFRQAVEIVHGYDLVISTRFHATVTANVLNIPNIAIAVGDYYRAKMNAAKLGFESICSLINPVSQSPEDFLNICKGKLGSRESGKP
jgi:polysaccharide pyruvyl transferase WcaK-like protein